MAGWRRLGTHVRAVVDDPGSMVPLARFRSGGWAYAYHGTSSVYAESIERAGLDPLATAELHDTARQVAALYRAVQWGGSDTRGFAVLVPWSLRHDVERAGTSHIYLAERYARAAIFANVAAGEFAQSLLIAIDDLFRFASVPSLREEHADSVVRQARRIGAPLALRRACRSLQNLDAWSAEVEALRPVRDELARRARRHAPVVYLVRLPEEMRARLAYSLWLGAKAVNVKEREGVRGEQRLVDRRLWSALLAETRLVTAQNAH